MKLKKKIKILILSLCFCTMFSSSIIFAANHDFYFTFDSKDSSQVQAAYYQKSDNEQKWYITIDEYYKNTTTKNTMSSSNVFACTMRRRYNDNVDRWHTFSNYVSSYGIDYATKVSQYDEMRIEGKKDSTSSSTSQLRVSGRFAP
ncbi:hypothetical protein GCM10023142_14450 [Anaerocolumna aminovalerica]|uniref:Uncharacterized protein n=1 Tax=Anaerocolumna aminovalerica TaxID=1527 RepID=A0A1I5F783_9FIRM|nr:MULTISPECIES: hypothetical protein [Bacillota]MBU5334034.1 hypothetical protein [Anaerocolumna aminovalerica]MDU6266235.1 hypothetical protein [Anaerocolumna aminovalerica]SFO19617.1 hypothetical protein SAMN04489757_11285 [Anaerocolumna aminovalerica]